MKPAANSAYWRYGLRSRQALNALSNRRVLEGFLIRVDGGYACVQPWPELGDAPLEEQWRAFCEERATPLLARARHCAAADAAARRAGVSLFAGLTIPASHATVPEDADFAALRAEGFTAVKLKGAADWKQVLTRMREAAAGGLRVRVDFNGVLTPEQFVEFSEAAADVREWVDFIEDPVPYAEDVWEALRVRTGWRLALDRASSVFSGGFDIRIIKPAAEEVPEGGNAPVITSYMDHPVGQAFAAWQAGRRRGDKPMAGLLTHRLFEPDAFTEQLSARGPAWSGPGGTGLGFDDLLGALPWVELESRPAARPGRVLSNPRDPLPGGGPVPEAGQMGFATSGSTGIPSVVVHTEESLEASSRGVNAWLAARAEDVWLRALPDFHVGGYQIATRAALSGSRVVAGADKWEPEDFIRICKEQGVTLTSLVPAQVVDLLRSGGSAPPALRAIVVGGGVLTDDILTKARTAGWPLLRSYGCTEAASQVATEALSGLDRDSVTDGMMLLPHWEARLSATDWEGAGLLELKGPALGLRRCVWQDSVWNCTALAGPDGWWTAADRVFLSGRVLTFSARTGRSVKVLGELVSLDLIERGLAALGMTPAQFCVVPLPDLRRGCELVLVTENSSDDPETCVAAWHRCAPPFARITRWIRVPALPRSPLGKFRLREIESLIPPATPP